MKKRDIKKAVKEIVEITKAIGGFSPIQLEKISIKDFYKNETKIMKKVLKKLVLDLKKQDNLSVEVEVEDFLEPSKESKIKELDIETIEELFRQDMQQREKEKNIFKGRS